jgi:hypothetical protein
MGKIAIEYNESAFRHGVGREDIRHAVMTKVYDAPLAGFVNKYVTVNSYRAKSSRSKGAKPPNHQRKTRKVRVQRGV